MPKHTPQQIARARELRKNQTETEGLLWSILRARQVNGLKFRRQHIVGYYFPDFACVSKKLIVEIDGEYHDETQANDLERQRYFESRGWKVMRFAAEDVRQDAEGVARAIAIEVDGRFDFVKRKGSGSGMKYQIDWDVKKLM